MDEAKRRRRRDTAIIAALVIAPVIVFAQLGSHEFLRYDDDKYLTDNPVVKQGLTWQGVRYAFDPRAFTQWHPLAFLSHMLDVELFGLERPWSAGAHHLVNLAFHVVNTLLVFAVLRSLTGAVWRSAIVAGLFAVHPLHVESVAWASERKDVLSALFFLLTLWAYVGYARQRRWWRYGAVVLLFACALLSKPTVVTLPCVLFLLDIWPLERIRSWRQIALPIVEKLPLLGMVVLATLATMQGMAEGGANVSQQALPFGPRIAVAIVSYGWYVWKTFIPTGLACFYPHPGITNPQLLSETSYGGLAAGVGVMLVAVTVALGWEARRRGRPYLIVGGLWFVGMIVPMSGLIPAGDFARADRYTYLSLIGLFIVIVWGAGAVLKPRVAGVLAGAALAACVVLSFIQVRTWRNTFTLFEHALEVTSDNWLAHDTLGNAYLARAEEDPQALEHAIEHYEAAIRIDPVYSVGVRHLLGLAHMQAQEYGSAIKQFRMVLGQRPDASATAMELQVALGLDAYQRKDFAAAARFLEQALLMQPQRADVHNHLGNALASMGRIKEAIAEFQRAVELAPDYAAARNNLAEAQAVWERLRGGQ